MRCFSACLLTVLFLAPAEGGGADRWEFLLHAEDRDRGESPVRVPLPKEAAKAPGLILSEAESGTEISIQRIEGSGEALFILSHPLQAGESRRYRLARSDVEDRSRTVQSVVGEQSVTANVSGRPVLTYNIAVVEPPQEFDGLYRRSGHIHPVLTPSGRVVTDEFPVDHPHQHGLFAAWVRTRFEDRPVDFWNQRAGTGTVEHRELLRSEEGPVFSAFATRLAHVDLSAPEGKKDVLHENWTVRTFAVPAGRMFDIESVQRCVAESPLVIEEYHYGGMAVRGSKEWLDQPEHDFLTSEGKTRKEGNHTRPNWVSMHGKVDGAMCGIAVFSHPENFRAPQPVRVHPGKPYFVFTPPVLGEFEIPPGEVLAGRYRFLTYDGEPDMEVLEGIWRDYADPPKIEWIADRESRESKRE